MIIIIDVPSIDEHVKKVESTDAKQYASNEIGEFRLCTKVQDLERNVIGLWQMLNCPA